MTAQACRWGSIRSAPDWVPRSSPRWFRTYVDGSPGRTRSHAEPRCGSWRDFDRAKRPRTRCSSVPGAAPPACGSACASGTGIAALERAPFVLRQPAPHAGILTGLDSPFQADLNDLTATAHSLRLFDLEKCGSGVPNREEQLRVFFQTGSAVAPAHRHPVP